MKNHFTILILTIFCLACSNKKSKQELKTETITKYSLKTELGELVKDEIKTKYSIGFYPNGSQKFFVGLIGYSSKDTTKYQVKIPNEIKKTDNKTFIYNSENKLLGVTVKKNDTTFFYNGEYLESPSSYSVFDKKNRLLVESGSFNTKKTYTQAKYNKQNDCTFAIIKIDYEPSDFDKKYLSEIELAKKSVEKKETIIFEAEYHYY